MDSEHFEGSSSKKKRLDIGEFRKIRLARAKESTLFIVVVMATGSSEHNQKNSKRLQQFVQWFEDQLVVTNHSIVTGVAVNIFF